MNKPTPRRPDAAARQRRRLGTLRGQVTRLTRRLAQVPTTVAYGSLGRRATSQLQPGRGLLFPVLRAAYHLRLQLHDHIAAVFPTLSPTPYPKLRPRPVSPYCGT